MKKIFKIFLIITFMLTSGVISSTAHDGNSPLFVTITSEWCHTCKSLKPVIEELKTSYEDRVTFLTLVTSSKESLDESRDIAREYSILDYFEANKNTLPNVAIFCPGGKLEKNFIGEVRKEIYTNALEEILTEENQLCSL